MIARIAFVAAVLAASSVVACSDDDEGDATATATQAAAATSEATAGSSAAGSSAAGSPTATATVEAGGDYPLVVRDLLGREVTLEAAPASIVALSPSAVELLYAVGGEAVARSSSATHPVGVEALPDIGPSYQPSIEGVIALSPDLVLADASAQAHLADAITGPLGDTPVVFVGAQAYDDVAASLRLLGALLGRAEEAEAAVAELEAAKADAEAAAAGQTAPRTLIINGAPDDFFVALPDSFVGDLARIAGAENVAAGQPQSGPFPGYTQLSLEAILAADPEVILAITAGPPGVTLSQGILGETAYAGVGAVASGRVHELDVEVYLQAPGPRAATGLRDLSGLLYPPPR